MRLIVKFSRRFLPVLFSAALLCGFAGSAHPEVVRSGGVIRITGTISESDVRAFADQAGLLPPQSDSWRSVVLNSSGGDVLAAMEIGEMVRKEGMTTQTAISPQVGCLSACVLIFAAGVQKIAGKVGIHRPHFDARLFAGLDRLQAQAKYDELAQRVRVYLAKMGMPDQLFVEMMQVPSNKIRMLTFEEMERFSLVGEDPAYAEWRRAQLVAKYGEQKVEEYDRWMERVEAFVNQCGAAGRSLGDCVNEAGHRYPSPLRGE